MYMCTWREFRSTCAFAQPDQTLHWAHFRYPLIQISSFWQRRLVTPRRRPKLIWIFINPSLVKHGLPCLSKQWRPRSVGFWRSFWRSQLIWICTVCHSVCEFISIIRIKESDWRTVRTGLGILICSAWQGLSAYILRYILSRFVKIRRISDIFLGNLAFPFNTFMSGKPKTGNWQTVQTYIDYHRMWRIIILQRLIIMQRLIWVFTVYK